MPVIVFQRADDYFQEKKGVAIRKFVKIFTLTFTVTALLFYGIMILREYIQITKSENSFLLVERLGR